jgi:predicted O-linked N-acetylglucosamine transferase (SPINDLY family)
MRHSAAASSSRLPARRDDLLDRAVALQSAKDFLAAEELYRAILRTRPSDLVALNNAAIVAKALHRPKVALLRLEKAVRHHPDAAEAHFNLANTLQELERLEEACTAYQRAVALRPDYVKAHLNLGNALDKLRRWEEAAASYRRALAHGGDDSEVHANLANCLKTLGMQREALVHFICATQLAPERADLHFLLGSFRFEMRDFDGGLPAFRRVIELEPEHEGARNFLLFYAQHVCDWPTAATLAPLVRAATNAALAAGDPCPEGALQSVSRDADPSRNLAVARASALVYVAAAPALWREDRRPGSDQRIRIGYLSTDFREHPVAHVMAGVLRRHDRRRFAVTAYSYGPDDGSEWRRRIVEGSDRFVDLHRVADDAAARRIHDDGIDVLVDLTLWTYSGRPRIAALRPAPVQVQYLGFPGTSGAPFFDYAIVDGIVVPDAERSTWSETLVIMPHCYFVADRDQEVATSGLTRAACGLPESGIVFCSFNQAMKIDPAAFDAWMRIVKAVPGSVLWLPQLPDTTCTNLRREAEQRGVAPDRLVFAKRLADKAQHLERLALADLVLDTLAYNGHTTTSDALWAGVPVISTRGHHFASRVSASMLSAAGLEEALAADVDDYVRLAIHLAKAPDERTRFRARLAKSRQSTPLFDTDRGVADLERAYEEVWAQHRAGKGRSEIRL